MRQRFVPSQYQGDLRNRLQRLSQGACTVDEYYKEMELLLIRACIHEDEESKMARFLHGLDNEISDFVEMFPLTLYKIFWSKQSARRGRCSGVVIDGYLITAPPHHGKGCSQVPLMVVLSFSILHTLLPPGE